MTARLMIVDDEEDARELIKIHLRRHRELALVGEAGNGADAIDLIEREKPDIVLLDIQMPEKSGLEVVMDTTHTPLFIFITAYDEFAIKAFELNAIDYLLKPFSASRFDESIRRASERIAEGRVGQDFYRFLLREVREREAKSSQYIKRIACKLGTTTHYIDTDRIILIEAADQYVNVHTRDKKYLLRQSMDYLEEMLDPDLFFRTHRSYIVRLSAVVSVEQFGPRNTWVHLKNGAKIKLSQVRKQLFHIRLNSG